MTAANQVAEASIRYLVETSGQNVPPGYSHTEIGVIPRDWSLCRVGDLAEVKRGAGSQVIQYSNESNGVRFIRINDFFENQPVYVKSTEEIMKFSIGERDILFAGTGNTAGASFIPKLDWIGLPHSYNAPRIRIGKNTSKEYVFHALQSEYMGKQHIAQFVGAAQPFLDTKAISGFFVAVPIDEIEQTAIANALSDADALINELEKLIAKKQAIKTATMQQLLTGRTRLPQFALREDGTPKGNKRSEQGEIPEDWKIVALNDLASIRSGGTPSTKIAEYWDGGVNWCTPTDITALQGNKYLEKTARTITELGVIKSAAEVLPIGTIVMTSRATIGECAIVQQEMTTNQGFKSFICNSMGNNEFLYYLLGTLKDRFIGLCSGSTFLEISTAQVRSFLVAVPKKEEQTSIAIILSDMDEEIQTLQQRLAKTRQIKQGMMQELLTGKTRLVKPAQKESANV
jgi:type I restriction enzyme S subunit